MTTLRRTTSLRPSSKTYGTRAATRISRSALAAATLLFCAAANGSELLKLLAEHCFQPLIVTHQFVQDFESDWCSKDCDLNDAIHTANACPGKDTIVLKSGVTHTFNKPYEPPPDDAAFPKFEAHKARVGNLALPSIEGDTEIISNGATLARFGPRFESPRFRFLHVARRASLLVDGVTFENGFAEFPGLGGAILNEGELLVLNAAFDRNKARNIGGAIFNSGDAQIWTTTFSSNEARHDAQDPMAGGAIANANFERERWNAETEAELTVYFSRFIANAAYSGGAVHSRGKLFVQGSHFELNEAPRGGALYLGHGHAVAPRNSFTGNKSYHSREGGAIYVAADAHLQLQSSTVSGNRGKQAGVFVSGGYAHIIDSTILDNGSAKNELSGFDLTARGGTVLAQNSIVGDDVHFSEACSFSFGATLSTFGTNLTDNEQCAQVSPYGGGGFELVVDLGLAPLAGGPNTQTLGHMPLPGSPVIDAGEDHCKPGDQFGLPRPVDGNGDGRYECDVGALELQTTP